MSKENTEELSEVVELTQEVAQLAEDAAYSIDRMRIFLVAGCGAALVGGIALGIYIAKRKYEKAYADMLTEEVTKTKLFYQGQQKPPLDELVPASEVHVLKAVSDLTRDYRTTDGEAEADQAVEDTGFPVWDYIAEEQKRGDGTTPYIISQAEFLENEPENTQDQLTYFVQDDTLADSQGEVLPEEIFVGENNLQFGHGSGDVNLVYIRNPERGSDFEVIRSDGSFAHEVLGLEHSDDTIRRRGRRPQLRDD